MLSVAAQILCSFIFRASVCGRVSSERTHTCFKSLFVFLLRNPIIRHLTVVHDMHLIDDKETSNRGVGCGSVISLFYAATCQPPPFFHLPKADEHADQHQPNLSGATSPKGMRFLEMDAAPWSVSPPGGHLCLSSGHLPPCT